MNWSFVSVCHNCQTNTKSTCLTYGWRVDLQLLPTNICTVCTFVVKEKVCTSSVKHIQPYRYA